VNLGCHVRGCAELSGQQATTITAFKRCRKSKIGDLEVEGGIKDKVLRFEITVNLALRVHVAEAIEHLTVVVSGLIFTEAATKGDEVEKLTATNEFEHDIVDLLLTLARIGLHTTADFDEAHNVWVLEGRQGLALSVDQLLELLVRMDDLDGVAGIGAILSELDFAGYAAAERSS